MASNVSSMKSREAEGVLKKAEESATNVLNKVQTFASDAVEKAQEFSGEAVEKAKEAVESVPSIIRRYPLESLIVGFGLGMATAFLINRAR